MAYGHGYPPAPPTQYGYRHGYSYGYGRQVRLSAPASVHLIAILQYLGGVLGLLGAGLLAVASLAGRRYLDDPALPGQTAQNVVLVGLLGSAVLAAGALFTLVVARKLQRGRQWARVLLLLLASLNLLGVVYAVFAQNLGTHALGALAVPVVYLVLLNTRAARSWFRRGTY